MKKIRSAIVSVITAFSLCSGAIYSPALSESYALSGEGFRYEIVDNEIVITGYDNTREPEQVIPEEIDGLPVTTIKALWGNIDEIIIPPSVKKIESKAFKGNFYLRSAVIPSSVNEIGTSIFEGCEKLEYCKFDADVEEIPKSTFLDCSALKTVDYPETIRSLQAYAFSGCSSLESVYIPPEMTELPTAVLRGCSSLTSIEIPEKLVSIGERALSDCSGLTEINIPATVSYIGEYAFSGCSSVTEMTIPEKVELINDGLFNDCSSLTGVRLPKNALNFYEKTTTRIYGASLFRNCSLLRNVDLPYGLVHIGQSCFDGCTSLENVFIPDTVETIDDYAFRNCSSLSEIDIPRKAVVYGVETFRGCSSLRSFYAPETLYDLGNNGRDMFRDCVSLESVYLPLYSTVNSYAFKGCDNLKEIYIGTLGSTYAGKTLGYIYDEATDTYTKNEDLTIYCREGSNAQKYAVDNGFNYEIVNGYDARIAYMFTYGKDESDPDKISLSLPYPAFISGDGEYRVSESGASSYKFNDVMDIIISTDMSAEEFPDLVIIPSEVNFNGYDISEFYDDAAYSLEVLDDGMYYLFIHAEAEDLSSKNLSIGKVNVFFNVYTDGTFEYLMGDVNSDGKFNISDAVIMQKWLLAVPGVSLINWEAGDFTGDGVLDVFDFCLMKKALIMLG